MSDGQLFEALRSIELAAGLNDSKRPVIIGVTSALPGEGKSTLAAALAFHVARRTRRVLLVDCDLRHPSLSRAICPGASCGLSEMADGAVSAEDAVRNGLALSVNFLPARSGTERPNGMTVVDGRSMHDVFAGLRKQYDVILLDLPPLAPVIDARAVAELIDSYVLVVEWGETKIDIVRHALRAANGINGKLIGAVLNKVKLSSLTRYDRHLGEYYSADYFKGQGAALQ